jgi:Na+-driven multidrug efflux pump
MNKKNHHSLLDNKLPTLIWANSQPMITAILLLFIYELLESTLVALANAETLTSFGFTVPITAGMTALAIGTSIRCNNKVVKSLCLKEEAISKTVSYALVISSMLLFVLSITAYLFSEQLLSILGSNNWFASNKNANDTFILTQQINYIDSRFMTWIFLGIIWQVNAILRAINQTALASHLMISWIIVKCIIAIALLYPSSPLYSEGLHTLAAVHGISDLLFMVISLYIIHSKVRLICPTFKELIKHIQQPKIACSLVIAQQLITPLSMAILTIIAASYNATYIAAFALIFKLDALLLLIPMVLTTSMPAIIGVNFWSGYHNRVRNAYRWMFGILISGQVIIAISLSFSVDFWSSLLCPHDGVTEHLQHYLIWLPWGYIGAACAIVYQSTLNAKDKVFTATLLGVFHRIILVLPLSWFGMKLGEFTFYVSLMFAHIIVGAIVLSLFILSNNKAKTLTVENKTGPFELNGT